MHVFKDATAETQKAKTTPMTLQITQKLQIEPLFSLANVFLLCIIAFGVIVFAFWGTFSCVLTDLFFLHSQLFSPDDNVTGC